MANETLSLTTPYTGKVILTVPDICRAIISAAIFGGAIVLATVGHSIVLAACAAALASTLVYHVLSTGKYRAKSHQEQQMLESQRQKVDEYVAQRYGFDSER